MIGELDSDWIVLVLSRRATGQRRYRWFCSRHTLYKVQAADVNFGLCRLLTADCYLISDAIIASTSISISISGATIAVTPIKVADGRMS